MEPVVVMISERPFVVVMAGGSGTRFWPASTDARPKQLLALTEERTLLRMAVDRALLLAPPDQVLVVTSASLELPIRAQLPDLASQNILVEPVRRDTAAAISLAALTVLARAGADARMVVLTADHLIEPIEAFLTCIELALDTTKQQPQALVTFGVVPFFAATGYGYLEVEEEGAVRVVRRFVEKPDEPTARSYLETGQFWWNSGMFVWRVGTIVDQLISLLPNHVARLVPAIPKGPGALARAFQELASISIDKGVMEKAPMVLCVPARFSWSDVGSFPALVDHLPQDEHGNASRGRLVTLDGSHNVVWNEDPNELVAIVGLSNIVVVRAGNRTLIVPKDRAEDVKRLVGTLANTDR
jgi:mannose-1-phosphate guanylyltransferase